MTRKPANPRPYRCIACGDGMTVPELTLAFEKATGMIEHVPVGGGHIVSLALRETFGLPPLAQAEAEAALAEHRKSAR